MLILLFLLSNLKYNFSEVTTKTGDIEKLLRIRNPWGKLEWNGDWSDNSEKWTPELKKQLKVEDVDDGTFFMSFKDFLRFFTTSYICKYHDNYFYESIKISYKPNKIFHLISIDFKEKNHGYFILNMKNSKIYKNLKNKKIFKNFYCTFLVYKVEKDNQFKLVGSKSSRLDRKHVEANIDPGTYVVAVHFPKELNKNVIDFQEYEKEMDNFKEKISFRLGFYSMSKGTLFKEIETESNYYSILHSLALQMSNDNKLKEIFFQEGEPETWRCLDFSNEIINGFGFLAYNNMSNATIREKLYLTSFVNIRLIPLINIDNENKLSINSEDVIEDEYEDVLLKTFRKDLLTSNSTVKHELKNSKIKEITEENPLIIEICIAPKSTGVLLIEKFEEFASIKASSEINMVFPFDFIYSEKRFNGKKTRIKYKNDFLNIFENIIKYPTGVMFKYKNKTKEYKIEITIHFESLQNLQFNRSYLKNYLLVQNEYRKLDKRTDDEKMEEIVSFDEENQRVKITLYPSHSAFIELISINQFIDYSFKSNIDYKICLSEFYFSSKIK